MRKVFTLVMTAAAALSVSAAPARQMVRTSASMVQNLDTPELQKIKANNAENFAMMSRAGEDETPIDLSGHYYTGAYDIIATGETLVGQFIESLDFIDIAADPEVENGYIIKGFLQQWWNNGNQDGEDPITVKDIKATWDPQAQTLTIAPYQELFEYTFKDASGKPADKPTMIHLTGADPVSLFWSKTTPIVLDYQYGILSMDTEKCAGFALLEIDETGEQASGFAYQFGMFNAYVPNGTLKCYMPDLSNNYTFDIHGVWLNGYTFINNFTGRDPLTICNMKISNDRKVLAYDGLGNNDVGHILLKYDYDGQKLDNDYILYAAEMNEDDEPTGTGWTVNATIDSATDDAFKATFPRYGLFTSDDELFTIVEDAVLEFKPADVAGIKGVAAADADNTNAPVRYYNLQGMSVNNPANGIFIRVQGTDVQKVLVK